MFEHDYDMEGLQAGDHWDVDGEAAVFIICAGVKRIDAFADQITRECADALRTLPQTRVAK